MGTDFECGMMRGVQRWMVAWQVVAQQWECTSSYRTVYLKLVKMVDFMLHVFYRNKKKNKKKTSDNSNNGSFQKTEK